MPTYDYECPKCGHRFEKFEAMSAEPGGCCPKCGTKGRRRIGAGAGLIFKGSGFYTTDYRKADYKKDAERDNPPQPAAVSGKDKDKDKGGGK